MTVMPDLKEKGLCLIRDENGLKLTDGELELSGDFTKLLPRLKYNNLTHEILIKAAKIKVPKAPVGETGRAAAENADAAADSDRTAGDSTPALTLIDATAGLGEDSLLFAAAGFRVTMFERDPVIAALLKDAMERAKKVPELAPVVERMKLVEIDSISALRKLAAGLESHEFRENPADPAALTKAAMNNGTIDTDPGSILPVRPM